MKKINVLIVDKDVLARQAIAQVLQGHSEIFIAGLCGDVEHVASEVTETNPNVVLLNVNSVKSEVISVLTSLRARFPSIPVIVLSPRTKAGAEIALLSLRLGAVDFVTKPEYNNNLLFARRHLTKRLIPVIKAVAGFKNINRLRGSEDYEVPSSHNSLFKEYEPAPIEAFEDKPYSVVVVGACTGGPDAIFKLIPDLPADFPLPVIVVQHFPKFFTKELAMRLNENSALAVREAHDAALLDPGTVWIAPGGFHSEIYCDGNKPLLKVHKGPREKGVRPSIDLLFRSATRTYGSGVLACLLSGCGEDGLEGAKFVREAGGTVLVQNPRTAIAPELPLKVIRAGAANAYCSINKLAHKIVNRVAGNEQHTDEVQGGSMHENHSIGVNPPGSNKLYTHPI